MARRSRPTGRETGGIEVRESESVTAPVTLGVVRPVIVLPMDWPTWDAARLEAVLAHERSHVARHDPAMQMLALVHRALLWHSPMSWFLHTRMVRAAEEASDDAAVSAIRDRVLYAEVLLDFTRRGVSNAVAASTPMARYGPPEKRIHRILDGATLSRGITRGAVAAILAIGSPLAYVVAAAQPQNSAVQAPAPKPRPVAVASVPQPAAPAVQPEAPRAQPPRQGKELWAMGNAAPSATVTVTSRVEGQLLSVNFKEGDTVQAGQLLATIDPSQYQIQLNEAQARVAGLQRALDAAFVKLGNVRDMVAHNMVDKSEVDQQTAVVQQLESQVQALAPTVDAAKLHMTYTKIVAPISGVVGFRLLDPGNMVHPGEQTPIVIINQLQPMMVVFSIPAEELSRVRASAGGGANLPVEAWSRDRGTRFGTGRLVAVDNQIDIETGTVKLKAEFDNKNGALLPGQMVNARLALP
jgi:multidrug efflux system membrane fusion protein